MGLGGINHIREGLNRFAKFRIILGCLCPDFESLRGEIDIIILGLVENAGFLIIEIYFTCIDKEAV